MNEAVDLSDSHPCFVFGFELDGSGGVTPCTGETQSDLPQWLHIDYSSAQAAEWLQARGVDESIIDTLVRPESRPRTIAADGGILVVLRGINLNPGADPTDMVSLRLWIEPGRLITVRQRRLMSIQDIRADLERGKGPVDLPALVVEIIERIANRIVTFVDDIEAELLQHEEGVEDQDSRSLRTELSQLRRQTAVVRRFISPLREALEGLARQTNDRLDPSVVFTIRDQSDRITRAVEDLDLVRERTSVLQEELLNRLAQQQNDRLYLFSIVAAVFLPISFITGLFGMNTAGLPGSEDPVAFWLVVLAMASITVGTLLFLRAKRWF